MPKTGCPVYPEGSRQCSRMRAVALVMKDVLLGREISQESKRLILDTKTQLADAGCDTCSAKRRACNETSGKPENPGQIVHHD